jgi:hypothetical protein
LVIAIGVLVIAVIRWIGSDEINAAHASELSCCRAHQARPVRRPQRQAPHLGRGINGSQRVHLSVRDGRTLQPVGPARGIVGAIAALADLLAVDPRDHRTDGQAAREEGLVREFQAAYKSRVGVVPHRVRACHRQSVSDPVVRWSGRRAATPTAPNAAETSA